MKSEINRPNQKFDHVYIVMRYDSYIGDPRQAITVLKVFPNESDAIAEVERLNLLRKKRCHDSELKSEYYVTLGRIKKGILKEDAFNP